MDRDAASIPPALPHFDPREVIETLMTSRYGIFVVPQPEFTARAYRARQIICGQYGAWAAEMLMVHIMLAGFFPCSDDKIESLVPGLENLAAGSRDEAGQISLKRRGVATAPDVPGTIFLEFDSSPAHDSLTMLHGKVAGLVNDILGPGAQLDVVDFRPRLPLMQFASLPSRVFSDAAEFARGVVDDMGLPELTTAWRLMLARFNSQAAGDGWEPGSWATDISWELISSHAL